MLFHIDFLLQIEFNCHFSLVGGGCRRARRTVVISDRPPLLSQWDFPEFSGTRSRSYYETQGLTMNLGFERFGTDLEKRRCRNQHCNLVNSCLPGTWASALIQAEFPC